MKACARAIQKWAVWLPLLLLAAAAAPSVLAQQPSSGKEVQTLLETGQTAYDQGRYDDALRAYNKALALSATSPKTAALTQLKIGNVYMSQQKFDAGATAFQKAIALDPDYALAYNNLGEALG